MPGPAPSEGRPEEVFVLQGGKLSRKQGGFSQDCRDAGTLLCIHPDAMERILNRLDRCVPPWP